MIRRPRLGALAPILLLVLGGAAAPAYALDIPARKLSFVVEREGTPIGRHVLTFTPEGPDGATVDIATDVAVKALFVTVYRFEQRSHEEWREDHLVSLATTTNDDGTAHDLRFSTAGDGATGVADGAGRSWPAGLVPASLWNRAALARTQWLNTVDGKVMAVSVTDLGEDALSPPEGVRQARHYRLDGDLARDLWYDAAGRLVAVAFAGKDGSAIRYRLDEVIPLPAGAES